MATLDRKRDAVGKLIIAHSGSSANAPAFTELQKTLSMSGNRRARKKSKKLADEAIQGQIALREHMLSGYCTDEDLRILDWQLSEAQELRSMLDSHNGGGDDASARDR